jgi:formylglycine-generating enzyme required for sulfatase activity
VSPQASSALAAPVLSTSAPLALMQCPTGMVPIPGGKFFIGSDDADAMPFEKPSHKVTLHPYCMDKTEVTVAAYRACSDGGGCKRAPLENSWAEITSAEHKAYDPLCNARDASARGQHPINCVDWEQAENFCREQDKRLPTEAEWEFAARGPDGRRYPWGDDPPTEKRVR